jgi:cardiolipin synthase
MLKNIPNALTILRLILVIPFLSFLYHQQYAGAFYSYVLAGFTDCFDGWLARHYSWQSKLGSFIDPLADKLLIASSFISLALIGSLPCWLVILVFMRDVTILLGVTAWYWLIGYELHLKPTLLSKINTTMQLGLVTLCLFELAFFELRPYHHYIINLFIVITALTTMMTYIDYVLTWSRKLFSSVCNVSK